MDFGVDPLDMEPESFPCGRCNGSGRASIQQLVVFSTCPECGGSGYGPPPPSLDREVSHCLQRLSAWAHRDTVKQEN